MKNEAKIVELLTEVLRKSDVQTETVAKLSFRFNSLEGRFDSLERRFDSLEGRFDALEHKVDTLTARVDELALTVDLRFARVENELVKLNLICSENSRALLKMADNSDRIARLEKAVFKQ